MRVVAGTQERVAVALGVWGGWDALYRLYYALGGDVGMVVPPRRRTSGATTLVGAVIIALAAPADRDRPDRVAADRRVRAGARAQAL